MNGAHQVYLVFSMSKIVSCLPSQTQLGQEYFSKIWAPFHAVQRTRSPRVLIQTRLHRG